MLPITSFLSCTEPIDQFECFSTRQKHHAKTYVTGLVAASNKTVQGISNIVLPAKSERALNKFLTEYNWDEDQLNNDDIDEYNGIDAHLAITHDDTYVIGDAYVNSCENRHSFLRQWLAKFRGVSKHHLQGYLNFLGLLLNDDTDWFSKILSYESSG